MVALQILALSVRVRILLSQLFKKALPECPGGAFSVKTVLSFLFLDFEKIGFFWFLGAESYKKSKRLRDDALTCFANPLVRSGMILFGICVRGYYLRREKTVAK